MEITLIVRSPGDAIVAIETLQAYISSTTTGDIGSIGLPGRTVDCLRAEGVNYIGDLTKLSANALLRTPSLGRKSVDEIRVVLSKHGLCLQGDQPTTEAK